MATNAPGKGLMFAIWKLLPPPPASMTYPEVKSALLARNVVRGVEQIRWAAQYLAHGGFAIGTRQGRAMLSRGPLPMPNPGVEPDSGGQFGWTDEKTAELRRLRAEGMTCPAIAKLWGVSKGTIVGRVGRVGAHGNGPPRHTVRNGPVPKPKRPVLPAFPGLARLPKLQSERAVPLLKAVARERHVTPETPLLMLPAPAPAVRSKVSPSLLPARKPNGADELYTAARSPRMCQWITVERPKVRMCSAVVSSVGSPWCLTHRAMCFTRAHGPRPADDAIPTNPHHSVRLGR